MTVTAHNKRRVYSGAIRPTSPPPDRNTIWTDDDKPVIQLTDADHRPIPFVETCTYNQFLQHLTTIYGSGYLCRPDGAPLEPRG
jgi:hypothetical protein